MAVYDKYGNEIFSVYAKDGSALLQCYDKDGNELLSGRDYPEYEDLLTDRLLIWSDEFSGSSIDTSKWSNIYGNYRNFCWNSPDIDRNTSVGGGILSYWCAKDNPNEVSNFSGVYIHTNNKFEFRYGRIEAKMKFSGASPHHDTFWTLGACSENINTGEFTPYQDVGVHFPSCGEIDVAEYNNGVVGFRTHWATNGFDATSSAAQGGNNNSIVNTPTDWHIYSCEWTETTITCYVDGVQKSTWDISNATVDGWNPFTIPHYLIFNTISATGNQQSSISWERAETEVAWVRVYAPEGVTEYINETAISIPNTLSISIGERSWLEPTFTPVNPSDMTLTWASSDESIAKVYGGMVIGVASGTATITVTTKHGYTATCVVTVS